VGFAPFVIVSSAPFVILSEAKDRFRAKAGELRWIHSDPSVAGRFAPAPSG
jgi:hypothetical protein